MVLDDSTRFKENNNPFTIADLGTADSLNSIPLFKAIIDEVRKANKDLEIIIYLNDLPFSDLTKGAVAVQEELA
jgi:hypothetical protein